MAFKIGGNTAVNNSGHVFDSGTRVVRKINGQFPDANGEITVVQSYLYRATITKGFMMGGYKDASPWKNVNRIVMATDVTTNLGDQMTRPGAYISAGWDEIGNVGAAFGTIAAFQGTASQSSLFNMTTEVGMADNTGLDMHVARDSSASMQDLTQRRSFVCGGGSTATSKIMWSTSTNAASTDSGAGGNHSGAIWGETYGHASIDNTRKQFKFSDETWATWNTPSGINGCQKGLSSKLGWGYIGRDGSCGSSSGFDKYRNSDGVRLSGPFAKPNDGGEENMITGQTHGYCLGLYNGAQVNTSYKMVYATDVGTTLGSTGEPKGHAGASSGGGISGV